MKGLLKCYYGYKNRGDEVLFFGIVPYIFDRYGISKLLVEVGDKAFMHQWIEKNASFLGSVYDRIELVQKGHLYKYKIQDVIKFFGGGEVLTDEIVIDDIQENQIFNLKNTFRDQTEDSYSASKLQKEASIDLSRLDDFSRKPEYELFLEKAQQSPIYKRGVKIMGFCKKRASKYFARVGWNYYLLYFGDIIKSNFVLLGGVSTPHKMSTKFLYKLLLPKAKEIVCRDEVSFALAKKYNTNVILRHDFALDVFALYRGLHLNQDQVFSGLGIKPQEYILINIHPKIWNEQTHQRIRDFCFQYPNFPKLYIPCDIDQDSCFFDILCQDIPGLRLYDWTNFSLVHTLTLFANAKAGIGARLHFLLPLQYFGVSFEPLVYAEKIQKLIKIPNT